MITKEHLPIQFTGTGEVKGMKFSSVHLHPRVSLFKVSNGKTEHFEVFLRVYARKLENFAERRYSETEYKEVYPKAKEFGVRAWSFRSYDKAVERYKSLREE